MYHLDSGRLNFIDREWACLTNNSIIAGFTHESLSQSQYLLGDDDDGAFVHECPFAVPALYLINDYSTKAATKREK
jgi:hypothetical protein